MLKKTLSLKQMAKKGGQIFQQQSSSQNTILMVLLGVLVIYVLYRAFFKSCPPMSGVKEKMCGQRHSPMPL
jgi:hypothetical protein